METWIKYYFCLIALLIAGNLHSQNIEEMVKSDSLFAKGVELYNQKRYEEAIPLFTESDRIDKAELDSTSNRRNYSAMWLASCYYLQGDTATAKETNDYYNVEPIDRRLTVQSDSLSEWGEQFLNKGDYKQALSCFLQCVKIEKEVIGDNHIWYANSLNVCAQMYNLFSDYEKAISMGSEAVNIYINIYGKEHIDYIKSLSRLTGYYSSLGNFKEAILHEYEVCVFCKKTFGKESFNYFISLMLLANYNAGLGNYTEALRLGTEAFKIGNKEEFYGAVLLSNLSAYNSELGNYSESIRLSMEALNISGKKHPNYPIFLNNLADSYSALGDYTESIRLRREALKIQEKFSGKKNPVYARLLSRLAESYYWLKNYKEAIQLETDALKIKESLFGKEHMDCATSLSNLACYNYRLVNYIEAIRLETEALKIRKFIWGKEHPKYAVSLSHLASYNSGLKNYHEAIRLINEALKINEKFLKKTHPEYIFTLGLLASFYKEQNNINAIKTCVETTDLVSQFIRNTFANLTIQEQNSFWNKYKYWFESYIYDFAFNFRSDSLYANGYNGLLLSKGLLLNSEISLSTLLKEAGDEEIEKQYKNLRILRLEIDRQREKTFEKRTMNIDSMLVVVQAMERKLVQRSKEYGDYTKNLVINWKQVQSKLKNNDIAIEFASFATGKDSTMYIAYCLRRESTTPKMIPLFEERQVKNISKADYYTTRVLADLIWKPLETELHDVRNVYFAPDGELYNIAIESLPDWEGKGLMSDKRNFYRLSSTRELALIKDKDEVKTASVYGGLKYNADEQILINDNKKYPTKRDFEVSSIADSLNLRHGVEELPATKTEAVDIDKALTRAKVTDILYTDTLGTEASFKALSGQKRNLLHIATHGFYWTEREAQRLDHLSFLSLDNTDLPLYVEDKAMTRSGLLFAGANHALKGKALPEGVDDGILTAKEISTLDLRGLDMVVLSACQTGLGEISGDGVFGLQRGFKKAGANTLLMSLWKVDDNATQMLMTQFYANLTSGKSKFESLREAQRYVREYEIEITESEHDDLTSYQRYQANKKNNRDVQLTTRKIKPYVSPRYWAAFILLDAIN